MGVRPARRQLWRQAQRPAIPGVSAAQPPLLRRQGGTGGQGQLAACIAGLSLQQWVQGVAWVFGQILTKILANWTVLRKINFSRENQTKAGYSVCFAHLFFLAGQKEN